MSVLVTTGSSIKSLIITRSLGKKGVEVIVGDKKNNSIAALSKYAKGKIKYTYYCEN